MVISCLYVQTVTCQCFCFPNSQWGVTAHDTEKRGYEWIVFTRQPDRKMVPTDEESEEQSYTESLSDPSDDDVFYNAETENAPPDQEADFPAPTTHDEGVLGIGTENFFF